MFPIGTIIYVLDAGSGARGVNSCIVQIVEKPESERIHGIHSDGFHVKILEYSSEYRRYGLYWKVRNEGQYIPYNSNLPFEEWKESLLVAKQFLI